MSLLGISEPANFIPATEIGQTAPIKTISGEAEQRSNRNPPLKRSGKRARLRLRKGSEGAKAVLVAAKRAAISPGDDVASLIVAVPLLFSGGNRSEHVVALTPSSFHFATPGRNILDLPRLLTQANLEQAQLYRDMLDSCAGEVS